MVAFILHVCLLVVITTSSGCLHPQSGKDGRSPLSIMSTKSSEVLVASGRFIGKVVEKEVSALTYEVLLNSDLSGNHEKQSMTFVVYSRTIRTTPENAILLLKRRSGQWEILGKDASRSIIEDTSAAREKLQQRRRYELFQNAKKHWLTKERTEDVAASELNIQMPDRKKWRFKSQRYEFGWEVTVSHRDYELDPGGDAFVVVGDDGEIKYVSLGI